MQAFLDRCGFSLERRVRLTCSNDADDWQSRFPELALSGCRAWGHGANQSNPRQLAELICDLVKPLLDEHEASGE